MPCNARTYDQVTRYASNACSLIVQLNYQAPQPRVKRAAPVNTLIGSLGVTARRRVLKQILKFRV